MIKKLNIYRLAGAWVFDDEEIEVYQEPFVLGSSEIIDEAQRQLGIAGDTMVLEFSDAPFDGSQFTIKWQDSSEDGSWNKYLASDLNMTGWLCPVLLKYYNKAPELLYMRLAEEI